MDRDPYGLGTGGGVAPRASCECQSEDRRSGTSDGTPTQHQTGKKRSLLRTPEMRILLLCHRSPFPPNSGAKVRPFHMIRHFNAAGHDVTVCSLARSPIESKEGEGIGSYCSRFELAPVRNPVQVARMVLRLPSSTPSSMAFFFSRDLKRRVNSLLSESKFDLILVHCSSVAQYVEDVQGIPKILDFCDMDSQKWVEIADYKPFPLSLGYRLEGRKLAESERRLAAKFDLCTVATPAEKRTLEALGSARVADWFPNGVDGEYFRPDGGDYDPDMLTFIGRMDYYPNEECMTDFCHKTLPLIRQRRPQVKMQIVGADPTIAVRKLGELPGVTVTGSVPDVRPYVCRSAATVAPLNIARGTQNKILEAMAMGVPVVTSSIGAGGVDAEPETHFLVADGSEAVTDACLRLLNDRAERSRLAVAGRARVLSNHTWSASMERLDEIIDRVIPRFSSGQGAS